MSETEDTFEIIWCDAAKIRRDENRARQLALKQHNETYMPSVYWPATKALQERCEKLGHKRGDVQDNGMGHWWINCYYCGKELERGSEAKDLGTKWNQRMDELGAKRGTIEDLNNI